MNGGFELLNGRNSMIIGGEKMRFTSEKRPFLHKYTVQNADFCLKLKKKLESETHQSK